LSKRLVRSVGTPKRTHLELLLEAQINDEYLYDIEYPTVRVQLPKPEIEYRFHPERRWRFDFAWPEATHPINTSMIFGKVAVEVEGGTFVVGRHSRGRGYEQDCEKYAEALILGWRVLRVTTDMVKDGRAIAYLRRLFR
jgi:hypothetical protein